MNLTDIFVIAACAFLGFFIVSSMMGSNSQAGEANQNSTNPLDSSRSGKVDLRKKSDKP